jgi:hypothetical protein
VNNMAAEWYYRSSSGRAEGPVTAAHLKQLAQLGEIGPETEIKKGAEGRWITANRVKGLMETPPTKPTTIKTAPAPWRLPVDDGDGSEPSPNRPKPPSPLVRTQSLAAEATDRDHLPVPLRYTVSRDVIDAEYTVTSPASSRPLLLLVRAGVVGTLIVVGVVAFAFWMFSEKDENKSPQRQVAQNPKEKQRSEPPSIKNDTLAAVGTTTSPSLSTPEATLKGYLAAGTWEERLPYVLNADRVRPEMAKVYQNTPRFKAENFLPGTIVAVENRNAPVGGRCMVTVDVHTSSPGVPRWTYILVRMPDGFKVDWEASREQYKKEQNEALQAKLRELNPVLDIEVLRCKQSYSSTEIEFRLTNRSTALFSYVAVTMSIHSAKDEYLGSGFTNATNVRAGQSIVEHISFDNVKVGEVASWKIGIQDVTIDRGDGQRTTATTVFKLSEQLAGSDKGYQRKLESRLAGHWRNSSSHYYFSSDRAEAVFVDKKGDRRVFRYNVMERNYSAGAFQLRFVSNEGTGHQRSFTIKEEKMVITQPTHLAIEVGEWRELKDEFKDKFTEDWTYVDQQESP